LTINNIGSNYYNTGDYQKALEYHLESLEIRKKLHTENNSNTAFAYNKVAMDYEALGEKEKALEHYQEALAIYSSLPGQEAEAEKIRQVIEKFKQL